MGYIPILQVYTGKDRQLQQGEVGLTARVVNDLIPPYDENKCYHFYVDNFYTSTNLFLSLYEKKVYACGTLRRGRRNVPDDIMIDNPRRHERGYTCWSMAGPILAQSWLDTKPVYFLSTIHQPLHSSNALPHQLVVKRRGGHRGIEVPCPPLLHDYNVGMGGVDFNDRQRKFYNLGRRSTRWYRRVYFYLLEVTIHNAYIVKCQVDQEKSSPLEFRINLVTQLVGSIRTTRHVGRPRSIDVPRLANVGSHIPIYKPNRTVCKVCSILFSDSDMQTRPSRSYIYCEECPVALCLNQDRNCFNSGIQRLRFRCEQLPRNFSNNQQFC